MVFMGLVCLKSLTGFFCKVTGFYIKPMFFVVEFCMRFLEAYGFRRNYVVILVSLWFCIFEDHFWLQDDKFFLPGRNQTL